MYHDYIMVHIYNLFNEFIKVKVVYKCDKKILKYSYRQSN